MDSVDLHTEVTIFISLKGDNDGSHGLKVYHGSRGARDSRLIYMECISFF